MVSQSRIPQEVSTDISELLEEERRAEELVKEAERIASEIIEEAKERARKILEEARDPSRYEGIRREEIERASHVIKEIEESEMMRLKKLRRVVKERMNLAIKKVVELVIYGEV